MSDANLGALTEEIARATFPCGCHVIYSVMGSSPRPAGPHVLFYDFPHRVSAVRYLREHEAEGRHVVTGRPELLVSIFDQVRT